MSSWYCRNLSCKTDTIKQTKKFGGAGDSNDDEPLFIDAINSNIEVTDSDCYTALQAEGTSIRYEITGL